jgi:hypothetical protein
MNYDSWLLSGPGGPDDPVRGPSELVEEILGVLENASVPQEINDQIVKLIESWERSKVELAEPDWQVPDDEPGDPAGFCGWGPEYR